MATLELGSSLEGKYEILQRLEGGGMGEVYLVRHIHLQELRVIKLLRRDLAQDQTAAQRFHREARTATQIKHPHVATLYDYSRLADGRFYMVWEFISGEDVKSFLRRRGSLPLVQALDLGIQTLRGLEAVHAAHVIHRDISPDNLMITTDRQRQPWIKIIDLGLAKSLSDSAFESQAGSFGGKLRYCSPEQAGLIEGGLDHRSDLYSFAIVLYEMITGLLPFDVKETPASLYERFQRPPLPLRGRNPQVEVPEDLDRVVGRALAFDRETRFPDAASFIGALLEVVDRLRRRAKSASRRQISERERQRILANLDERARRIEEGAKLIGEADRAIKGGRFAEARGAIERLESLNPRLLGLAELKKRLAESEARRRQIQVMQTEEILQQYIHARQANLANMALETLLELHPEHPEQEHYRSLIDNLREADEKRQDAAQRLARGRQSLSSGDLEEARRQLAILEDGAQERSAAELRRALEASEREGETAAKIAELKDDLEDLLQEGRADDVAPLVEELVSLGVPKVVSDLYRHRLEELRAHNQRRSQAEAIENRFPAVLAAEDWAQARELALELESLLPASPRPGEMFSEIAEREQEARRRLSIEEGTATLEGFLDEGRLAEAEIAWRILCDLEPRHPQRRRFLKQLKVLRKQQQE